MTDLTPAQLAVLEAPCATCGHHLDDHGGLIPCWLCEDEGREDACDRDFMGLLAERIARMVEEARHA